MKKLLFIFCGLLFASTASASLYQYYADRGQQLPPVSERIIIAETCNIDNYTGTYEQNIALEDCLNKGESLGIALPNISALFETSLQNSVASDATTMTLVSATLKNGNSLSGLYGFIIDEGNSNEEFVICTASSTDLTACSRGIDPVDGKTEVTALKSSHRRGASIKITDYPILGIMRRILNGDETLPNHLTYSTTTYTYGQNQLVTWDKAKDYTDTVGAGGFTSANVSTTRGLSVDGSAPERVGINASSTTGMAFGSDGKLYQKVSTTAGLYSDSNGIGINYASNNTWTGTNTFNGNTTLSEQSSILTEMTAAENITKGDILSFSNKLSYLIEQTEETNNAGLVGNDWPGQTFTLPFTLDLSKKTTVSYVRLLMNKTGSGCSNPELIIYSINNTSSPTIFTKLSSTTMDLSSLGGANVYVTTTVDTIVTTSSLMFLTSCTGGGVSDYYSLSNHAGSAYAGGIQMRTTNQGSSFINTSDDLTFRIGFEVSQINGIVVKYDVDYNPTYFAGVAVNSASTGQIVTASILGNVSGLSGLNTGSYYCPTGHNGEKRVCDFSIDNVTSTIGYAVSSTILFVK